MTKSRQGAADAVAGLCSVAPRGGRCGRIDVALRWLPESGDFARSPQSDRNVLALRLLDGSMRPERCRAGSARHSAGGDLGGSIRVLHAELFCVLVSVAMRIVAILALVLPVSLAVVSAPAGTQRRGCVAVDITDPDIAASFARLDRMQSPAAARICAVFLNDASAAVAPP